MLLRGALMCQEVRSSLQQHASSVKDKAQTPCLQIHSNHHLDKYTRLTQIVPSGGLLEVRVLVLELQVKQKDTKRVLNSAEASSARLETTLYESSESGRYRGL